MSVPQQGFCKQNPSKYEECNSRSWAEKVVCGEMLADEPCFHTTRLHRKGKLALPVSQVNVLPSIIASSSRDAPAKHINRNMHILQLPRDLHIVD
jgi:hypothetical protein